MKKVYLTKINQKDKQFYAMVEDPRLIVELLPDIKEGQSQEAQRPWSLKKVKEISNYVAGKVKISEGYHALGIIPNNPILAIKRPLEIKKEIVRIQNSGTTVEEFRYFLLLPETEAERKHYSGAVDAMDGQHRLLSFNKEYRDPLLNDSMKYEMVFSVFENLSINERKEVFMITNEKQDKVSTNLIRLLKKALGLLGSEEKSFNIINSINKESYSVLCNRIMFGSDKISKGYKENQLSKIIDKSGTLDTLEKYGGNNTEVMTRMVSNYLKSWQEIYNVSYQNPDKDILTKISGLRYILYLFPEIVELVVKQRKNATQDNFTEIILKLPLATKVDNVFEDSVNSLAFRGDGATVKLAKEHSKDLITYLLSENSQFDPTVGI